MYGSPGDRAVPRGSRPNPGVPRPSARRFSGRTSRYTVAAVGGGGTGGWYPYYPYYPYYGWGLGLGYYGYYDPWWWWGAPYGYDSGYYGYYGDDRRAAAA